MRKTFDSLNMQMSQLKRQFSLVKTTESRHIRIIWFFQYPTHFLVKLQQHSALHAIMLFLCIIPSKHKYTTTRKNLTNYSIVSYHSVKSVTLISLAFGSTQTYCNKMGPPLIWWKAYYSVKRQRQINGVSRKTMECRKSVCKSR